MKFKRKILGAFQFLLLLEESRAKAVADRIQLKDAVPAPSFGFVLPHILGIQLSQGSLFVDESLLGHLIIGIGENSNDSYHLVRGEDKELYLKPIRSEEDSTKNQEADELIPFSLVEGKIEIWIPEEVRAEVAEYDSVSEALQSLVFEAPRTKTTTELIIFDAQDPTEELVQWGNFGNWYNGPRYTITRCDPKRYPDSPHWCNTEWDNWRNG